MQRIYKGIALAASLWLASLCVANAGQDAFAEMALESFRETMTTHPVQSAELSVEQQAKYLMLVKNGLSLYRDGVLQAEDKRHLVALVEQQVTVSSTALGGSQLPVEQKELAKRMHTAALAAKQLLELQPAAPEFAGLMDNYHDGIGYDAYRLAQDSGIEQY
ncbi:hypothetical protein [Pseudomonas sp. MBLB4136]|uniref:hypothetical protein n=1 Tax=Pseudomonas sp. MBLB4136 TaxID=3451558 RepID=UPI003F75151E